MSAAITRLTDGQLQELMRTDPESAMKEARRRCLKRERDRERNWRDTDKGAFESSMLSLDEHVKRFKDPSKISTFSDGGTGAEAVRNGGVELPEDVLEEALKPLSKRDRDFVHDVLGGKRWGDMKLTRQGFNWKIRGIVEKLLSTPLQNPRFKT